VGQALEAQGKGQEGQAVTQKRKMWRTVRHYGNPIHDHIVPVGDLVMHEPTDCVCGPRAELVVEKDGEGPDVWLVVH
jgi:hypothetical protein